MGTAIKHLVPDQVEPSFVILTSGHSDAQPLASECPDVKITNEIANYKRITNDDLIRSDTRNCIAVAIWQQWASKG